MNLTRNPPRIFTLAIVAAAHLLAGYLMLLYVPTREAIRQVTAIMVTLVPERPKALQENVTLSHTTPPKPPRLVEPAIPKIELPPLPSYEVAEAPPNRTNAITASPTSPATPGTVAVVMPPSSVAPTPPTPATPPKFDADYLDNPAPAYPALSRRLGETGRVVLRVRVEANGTASEIQIATSSHFDRLDQAAIDAVRRWRFVPAQQDDRAITAWVLVPLNFSLRG